MGGVKQCAVKFSTVTSAMDITAVLSALVGVNAKTPARTALGVAARLGQKQCMN